MNWFLITYDRSGRTPVSLLEYPAADRMRALAERQSLILRHIADRDIEVVLLGARDLDEVRATHGRYFDSGLAAVLEAGT